MANLSGNSWKEIRHKRVIFTPKWQNCPVNKYYTINRILLLCIGLWPYQKSSLRHIIITFTTIMLISGVAFQLTAFITMDYNVDILLRILAYSIPWLGYTLKYIVCLYITQIRDLMERVQCDWNGLNNTQEVEIIKEYSAVGRFITIITSYHQKYFFPILLQLCVVATCGLTTVVATETINMSYVHHACGLFEVASCRIEQALHENMVQSIPSPIERSSIIYRRIIDGFNMYKRATEFIEMLKVMFKWAYSALLPLGVLSLSINLYRFSRLISSKDYNEMIVSFMFILGHFGYMLFGNYLGQLIIDHSGDVFYRTYNVQWYVAPLRAQKLLLLVMQRSMRHCTIIIGGLFTPSLEGFAMVNWYIYNNPLSDISTLDALL
ncbi:PREDICTED: uncharacterized protein LOC105558142 isoform X3 [Vollenhovia emeryi]|uniref:uncharacterized protein LOC105558142 isoform X3 n=1 Tax=Vollenhovia emeryi TaxID=411798 RepID=UPI0005F47319|nr:PREDICTED: uncharacterized protein LOC105558142 isoform X3 [Vollenhovia emeryi]